MPYKDPEKQREYLIRWAKETRERRRSEWFAANGPCARCGSWDDLELDHIDPFTKIRKRDHGVWTFGEAKREAELAKCQALCHSCHQKKSAGEKVKGERVWSAVLGKEQVREIRERCERERQVDLAKEFGVDKSTIYQIVHGKIWKEIA